MNSKLISELKWYLRMADIQSALESCDKFHAELSANAYLKSESNLLLAEIYIKLMKFKEANDLLTWVEENISLHNISTKRKFVPALKLPLGVFGEVKIGKDHFRSEEPSAYDFPDLNFEIRGSAATLRMVIAIYSQDNDAYNSALKQFNGIKSKLHRMAVNQFYKKIEDAKIIDYLQKKSEGLVGPSEKEVNDDLRQLTLLDEADLMANYADTVPVDFQLLLTDENRPLLVQNNIFFISSKPDKSLNKEKKIEVGKKLRRALIATIFSRICENKKIASMISGGSFVAFVLPLFRQIGINDRIVISTYITGACQFGLDFICNAEKQFMKDDD